MCLFLEKVLDIKKLCSSFLDSSGNVLKDPEASKQEAGSGEMKRDASLSPAVTLYPLNELHPLMLILFPPSSFSGQSLPIFQVL